MNITKMKNTQVLRIEEIEALDPVTVILQDNGGTGKVIIECYGEAWSTYFGGIGKQTLNEFLSKCDSCYLSNRIINRRFHKPTKREEGYVKRIAQAVIEACRIMGKRN